MDFVPFSSAFFALIWAFFLTVDGMEYILYDSVPVYVNKVGPYGNPLETYHYYQLPVCRHKEIVHKSLSLGQLLQGDRMAESLYKLRYQEHSEKVGLCNMLTLNEHEIEQLIDAIEANYYFEFIVDDLTVRNFLGRVEEQGFIPHSHQVFLFTHHHFVIEFNDNNVISVNLEVDNANSIRIDDKKDHLNVQYMYSVEWKHTSVEYNARIVDGVSFFAKQNMQIHWLSVINSVGVVFLIVGFIALILVSVVRHDFARYNDDTLGDADRMLIDNGWKIISTDVFRFPQWSNLFSAIQGVGCQLLTIVTVILTIDSLNFMNVHYHGFLNTLTVVSYALTSGIAGFVSARLYRQLDGKFWIWNINLTSGLFALPVLLICSASNLLAWFYQSTQTLPLTTCLAILFIWLIVGYPLTVIGGLLGRNFSGPYQAPCRGISFELYYIFSTVWGQDTYTLFYMLLMMFAILVIVTASVSVTPTYFQLSAEDYRWWWRSVFVGGSVGVFLFFYAVFFYFCRSKMTDLLQTAQYFSHVLLVCYGFALSLAKDHFHLKPSVRFIVPMNCVTEMLRTRSKLVVISIAVLILGLILHQPLPDQITNRSKIQVVEMIMRIIYFYPNRLFCFFNSPLYMVGWTRMALWLMMRLLGPFSSFDPDLMITDRTTLQVPTRVYMPKSENRSSNGAIFFIHGGGFVVGGLDMYEGLTRELARRLDMVFVSIDYRLAPEHPFPAGVDDCESVLVHFLEYGHRQYGVDPTKVVVMGDSAGGNLAAVMTHRLRRRPGLPKLKLQVLIYPMLQLYDLLTPSYQLYYKEYSSTAMPDPTSIAYYFMMYIGVNMNDKQHFVQVVLNNDHVPTRVRSRPPVDFISHHRLPSYFLNVSHYVPPGSTSVSGNEEVFAILEQHLFNPAISPLMQPDLADLPPAFILTCEYDILRDDGVMYVHRLKEHSIPVTWQHFDSGFHGMFNLVHSAPFHLPLVSRAVDQIARWVLARIDL